MSTFSIRAPRLMHNKMQNIPFFLCLIVLHQFGAAEGAETGNSQCHHGFNGSYTDTYGVRYSPEDFSKLSLNVRELFGSRWALDRNDRNESIKVEHRLFIVDAGLIHKNELTLRLEFTLMQIWTAPDLEFPVGLFKDSDSLNGTFISAGVEVLDRMWSPESYISSARESSLRIQSAPLTNVYIFKNRKVMFKARMNTKVGCTSSFQWYPVDVQVCALVIESFKAQRNLDYIWRIGKKPIELKMRRLMQYELHLPVEYDTGRNGKKKKLPFVRVKFTLGRKLGNNIIQVYTPTFLVVVLSWFSFWLGLDAIPGRISLLVTCMLTLVTMHGSIKNSIPPVHYITMMDIWLVCCMAMVFAAICEFVIVKYAHWRIQMKLKTQEKSEELGNQLKLLSYLQMIVGARGAAKRRYAWDGKNVGDDNDQLTSVFVDGPNLLGRLSPGHNTKEKVVPKKTPVWVAIDKVSRALFPSLFAAFNGLYWPVLLTRGTTVKDYDHAYYENM